MIKRFNEHAANERTFLAWTRTAVATIALGFLIEKFDMLLSFRGESAGSAGQVATGKPVELAGLSLMVISIVMMISSTIRFLIHKRLIDRDDVQAYDAIVPDVVLGVLLTLVGLIGAIYAVQRLSH